MSRLLPVPAALALAFLAASPAIAGDPPAEAPAATIRGRPLPRAKVYDELARRVLRGEDGERLLEQFLMDAAARREQARRGITVTDAEVRVAVDDARRRTAEQLARSGQKVKDGDPLAGFLKESGSTLEEFVAQTRHYLAIQKMARADLGVKGEVPVAHIELWLRDLLGKSAVTTAPKDLPPGAVAKLGEDAIPREEAGRWAARSSGRAELIGVVYDLAFAIEIEERAAKEQATLGEKEVEAEIERLRGEFLRQPGIEGTGVTFEDWLRDRQGLTLDEFRRDATFRALLLARKLAGAKVDAARVRAEWEAHPERYGETARIRRIVVKGEDKASVFGASARPMDEARRILDRAVEEIRAGKPFEVVARKFSEDSTSDVARGRQLDVSPGADTVVLPQTVLEAVFRAKEGETVGPLKAVDGWHLVLVEKRVAAPTFEECAGRVRDDLVGKTVREWKWALKNGNEVVVAKDL